MRNKKKKVKIKKEKIQIRSLIKKSLNEKLGYGRILDVSDEE